MVDQIIKAIEDDRLKSFRWKADYCRSNFLNPMIDENWQEAQEAYERYLKDKNNETS